MPAAKKQKHYTILKRKQNGTIEICGVGSVHDNRVLVTKLREMITNDCETDEEMACFTSENGWFNKQTIDELRITKPNRKNNSKKSCK
jgi:hypothetical protein